MVITRIIPFPDPGGGARTLAKFSVQVAPSVRVHGLLLQRRADGSHRFIPPNSNGTHVATFAPDAAAEITSAALAAYEKGPTAHDDRCA